eukprot:2035770-Pyramimonas_sp.AAC.1
MGVVLADVSGARGLQNGFEALMQELQLTGHINHPNITRLLGWVHPLPRPNGHQSHSTPVSQAGPTMDQSWVPDSRLRHGA